MIYLKNGYGITFDGKSYTLIQYAIQTSKNGEEKEIQKSISFHSTLEGALQGYSNCRMADLVADYDMDLKDVQHSYSFLNFKKYSRNYLKTFTKEELIDYIDMIYNNWSGMDISAVRVSKLGIETYKKLLINREALKLFVDWAEECDFGYDQLPDEYEKYKTDLEEKDLDYCEGLRYIAIQEAKEALKVYENHVEMMDEKLDEWEK